jgi:hypothetical protein
MRRVFANPLRLSLKTLPQPAQTCVDHAAIAVVWKSRSAVQAMVGVQSSAFMIAQPAIAIADIEMEGREEAREFGSDGVAIIRISRPDRSCERAEVPFQLARGLGLGVRQKMSHGTNLERFSSRRNLLPKLEQQLSRLLRLASLQNSDRVDNRLHCGGGQFHGAGSSAVAAGAS